MTVTSTPTVRPTLRSALPAAVRELAEAQVPSPRPDAEELACFALGVDRRSLVAHLDEPVPAGFGDLIRRRAQRVPLQHLTGRAYFRTLTLAVGPGVFVPRPETEVVVDTALHLLGGAPAPHPVVVDLGAGSGAIALSIAAELPHAVVHAVELSDDVWPWLARNAVGSPVRLHQADLAECLPELDGCVDLVVSNPPYIPDDAVPCDPEVARHDPSVALYSGADGLDHIRSVQRSARRLLRPGGWVVVEHADQQGDSAPAVFRGAGGWVDVDDHPDLAGRPRHLVARRAAGEEGR
ncbi:MAG: peptide chain release factor N(5)-glutamine methyltransferase [Actinomycetota bacterium]|nr:peptide chain release factor N(5)-glutamine methyltransferase [Actinomycetota bacterium]MDH5278357.1 peptide chain release factor N(5)-glutamine methyltransferase [Actinomycetota bacterium]